MKKFLFTVLCLLGLASYALADTYKLVTDASTLEAGDKVLIVASETDVAMSTTQNNNNRGQVEITKSGTEIIDPSADVQVCTLEASVSEGQWYFNVGTGYLYAASSSSNNLKTEATPDNNGNASAKITIDANGVASIIFQGKNTRNVLQYNQKNTLFSCYGSATQKAVSLYRLDASAAPAAVAAPSITMAEGVYNTVQITCATEGATIHYALNDGSLEEYTGPFAIPADKVSTVEAMAELGQDLSDAVTKTVYPNKVADIKTLKAIASPAKVLVDCKVTAIPGGNKNFFVTDGVTPIMIYSNTTEVENGTTFANMEGIYELYNGLPEFKSVTFGEAGTGAAIEPVVLTIDEVDPDFVCEYIRINDVEFNGVDEITDGTNTLAVYKNTLNSTLPEAGTYDIIGFIGIYDKNNKITIQLLPTEFISNGPVIETVETPAFSVAAGVVDLGTKVAITCATEGAAIHYTLDGTMPTENSPLYSAPISLGQVGTTVIKAIAVKEDMKNSEVATVEYTVVDPDATELTCVVDFSNRTSFPETNINYGDAENNEIDWTATNGVVFSTIGVKSPSGNNAPVILNDLLRIYSKSDNVVTVNVPEGYYFVALTAEIKQGTPVTFTVGEESTDVKAVDNIVAYTFDGNGVASSFSISANNADKNVFIKNITIVIDKLSALSDKEVALTDGKQFINAAKVEVASISYAREFTSTELWQAWYAPFEMNAADFAKVIVMTNATIEEGTVNLYYETVTGTMEANKPYIVKVKNESEVFEAATNTLYAAEEVVEDINGFTLTGNYVPMTDIEGKYAIALEDGNFHPIIEGATLKPFRFFLQKPVTATNAPIRIIVDGQGESGIESLINVVEEGVIYNLQGMPVEHPTTGVYIQNGKKIFVK